jgi:hypothetical protein
MTPGSYPPQKMFLMRAMSHANHATQPVMGIVADHKTRNTLAEGIEKGERKKVHEGKDRIYRRARR